MPMWNESWQQLRTKKKEVQNINITAQEGSETFSFHLQTCESPICAATYIKREWRTEHDIQTETFLCTKQLIK